MKAIHAVLLTLLLAACAGLPEGIEPTAGFELDRYIGKWYEIARLDHRFERGLEQVTAIYSIENDGTVRVANRGFLAEKKVWKEAVGKARFARESNIGHLKVSFFGPFYGPYVIFELDKENYQYAFVTGSTKSLWLLSRTPQVSDALKDQFVETIREYGYNTDELIFVNQQ